MYLIPKLHKNPASFRFIIASKLCSTKKISRLVSHIFKTYFYQTENFHKNAKFLSIYNKFWVLQNSDLIIDSLNKINKKKRIKSITIYEFSILYTKLPHDKLVDKLSSIIDFAFKGSDKI